MSLRGGETWPKDQSGNSYSGSSTSSGTAVGWRPDAPPTSRPAGVLPRVEAVQGNLNALAEDLDGLEKALAPVLTVPEEQQPSSSSCVRGPSPGCALSDRIDRVMESVTLLRMQVSRLTARVDL